MKTNFLAAFAIAVICLSAFSACTNEDTLGPASLPVSDLVSTKIIDTVDVDAYTILEDSVVTSMSDRLLLGNVDDPFFGKTSASFACKFSNTSYGKFDSNAICDSVVLTFGLDTTNQCFLGDSTSLCTIDVMPLTKQIFDTASYYGNMDISGYLDGTVVGSATVRPKDMDTMLTVRLDKSYGQKIISAVSASTFPKQIFGLYFKASDSNPGNCISKFYPSSKFTEYKVYYHSPTSEKEKSVTFSIASDNQKFNIFRHDYSGTTVEEQLKNPMSIKDSKLYLQSFVGTRIRLSLPGVKNLCNIKGDYITIIRANLIMPLADSIESHENDFAPIKNLICFGSYKETNTHKNLLEFMTRSQNVNTYTGAASTDVYTFNNLTLITKRRQYEINLTVRVKDMMETYTLGNEPNYYIDLVPANRVSDFGRSIISSPTNSDKPMKLVVEYAVYNK